MKEWLLAAHLVVKSGSARGAFLPTLELGHHDFATGIATTITSRPVPRVVPIRGTRRAGSQRDRLRIQQRGWGGGTATERCLARAKDG